MGNAGLDTNDKPKAALVLPERDGGLAGAYTSAFEAAGWAVARFTPEDFISSGAARECAVTVVDFGVIRAHPRIADAVRPGRLVIDLPYSPDYARDYLDFPFHHLDNAAAVAHDLETRELLHKKVRPVNCRIMTLPYPPVEGGAVADGEPGKMYVPADLMNHPWLEGLSPVAAGEPFPSTAPAGSFLAIPEYGPGVWPAVWWAVNTGLPLVAPGLPTFARTLFYGAVLFDPGSEDDFRAKTAILRRPPLKKKLEGVLRFGVVAPRHEKDTAGGAENHAAQLAHAIVRAGHEAEILTTRTDSMLDWNNNLPEGASKDGDVTVRRFATDGAEREKHHALGHKINMKFDLDWAGQTGWMRANLRSTALDEYITQNSDKYDYLLFIPYLYGTTFWGSQRAPEKSFLIPCFHREPPAFAPVVGQMAQWMGGVLYNTAAEMKLAERELRVNNPASTVVGVGADVKAQGDGGRFRAKYGVEGPFVLYVGRLQREKGAPELVEFFKRRRVGAGLVLVGRGDVKVADDAAAGIRNLGYLPEQDKIDAFAACDAFVLPSTRESFSIVIMEAWIQGKPVIANAECDVAREHIFTCRGGLLYKDGDELETAIRAILQNPSLARNMGQRGREYAVEKFSWDQVAKRLLGELANLPATPLAERLGQAAKAAAAGMRRRAEVAAAELVADIEDGLPGAAPDTEPTLQELLDRVEAGADISTEYKDFTHRAFLGGAWSKFRGAVTRHLAKNYIEALEGKQRAYNMETARALRKLLERMKKGGF